MPLAYYNEIEPYAAEWLENLILVGLIAPGDVDRRSIEDVTPEDLRGYTQCHFFAGIGGWSLALRLAGWPDDRPVWTGSCPCQPFSAAGKGKGAADERHLWPAWFHLIEQCRPRVVFGEQVEAAIKHDWLDLVSADLEGIGYAIGATCLPAASVGAPHGRSRLWFVADDDEARRSLKRSGGVLDGERSAQRDDADGCSPDGELENTELPTSARQRQHGWTGLREQETDGLAGSGSLRGGWGDVEWLWCADQKYRPTQPGLFPLAHGVPARVGRDGTLQAPSRVGMLRAYGNAIVPQVAAEVIRAYMEARPRVG